MEEAKKTYTCDGPCHMALPVPAGVEVEFSSEEQAKEMGLGKKLYTFCLGCVVRKFMQE